MKTVYRLVGFNKDTKQVVFSQIVPDQVVEFARRVAHFSDDPSDVGGAPLTEHEANDIAGAMGFPIDAGMRQWFLMPSAEGTPAKKREHA